MKQMRPAVVAITVIAAWAPGSQAAWDSAANRKASVNYDAVVHDYPAFRASRQHSECDSIESADLKAQCVATFDRPMPTGPGVTEETPPHDLQHPLITITNGPVHNPDDD
jgi:hypothetical protein